MAASPSIGDLNAPRMRGDARREQLIRVAIELFARKGFRGTTTKEIASAAGVTEALIFRHFPTKEALYEAILLWRVEHSGFAEGMTEMQELAERRDDAGLFRAVLRGVIAFHREHVDFGRLMLYAKLEGHQLSETFRQQHIRPFHDYLENYVATRQAEGAFRDVDPAITVGAILSMAFGHSMHTTLFRCHDVPTVDDDTAIETFIRIALDGLRRPSQPDTTEDNA